MIPISGIKRGALVCAAFVLLVLVLILAACHGDPPQVITQAAPPAVVAAPPVAVQPAPVVVQQAPSHDGFVTGMLMGHLLSGGGGGGVSRNTTVINKSVTNVTRVAPAPRTTYSTPARSSSYSYSSRSSSSSFGSFRGGRR
ncbi:hypothetical protein MAFF241648_14550 [Ralstonia solanacearum]|nr:hypothetical protein MAFF241648_14550 [Ralstonia solanacearum]